MIVIVIMNVILHCIDADADVDIDIDILKMRIFG